MITKKVAKAFINNPSEVDLSEATKIDDAGAEVLGTFKGVELLLRKLEDISEDAAKKLVQFNGDLILDGLKSLSWQTAKLLARARIKGCNVLSLNGLTAIDKKSAEMLSKQKGILRLDGLKEISDDVLEELCYQDGLGLSLNGLTSISLDQATFLGSYMGGHLLGLVGLETITDDIADRLSKYPGQGLDISGVKNISSKALSCFIVAGNMQQETRRRFLSKFDSELAKNVVQRHESSEDAENSLLYLSEVSNLEVDAAEELSRCKSPLFLGDLEKLSPNSAQALAAHKYSLDISGLREISDESAQALSQYRGYKIDLSGLQKMSPNAAKHLLSYAGGFSVGEFPALDEKTLRLAADRDFLWLRLNEQKELSVTAAKALGKVDRHLYLNGVSQISHEVAEALSQCEGHLLELNGLVDITPEIAKHLSSKRSLSLNGLLELSDEVAEIFGASKSWIELKGVKKLSDTSATLLSLISETNAYGGNIVLDDSIKISKKARVLLRASRRVVLR